MTFWRELLSPCSELKAQVVKVHLSWKNRFWIRLWKIGISHKIFVYFFESFKNFLSSFLFPHFIYQKPCIPIYSLEFSRTRHRVQFGTGNLQSSASAPSLHRSENFSKGRTLLVAFELLKTKISQPWAGPKKNTELGSKKPNNSCPSTEIFTIFITKDISEYLAKGT